MKTPNEISKKTKEDNKHFQYIYITLFILLLQFVGMNTLIAQNSWIGGTSGAEHEWNNPKNWSDNKVPDQWDDMVIVTDVSSRSGYFPIIKNDVGSIAHLRLESGASLTVLKEGKLLIDGVNTFNYGIYNVGTLINQGSITIENTALTAFENANLNIQNQGVIAIIDYAHDLHYLATHVVN